MKLQTQVTSEIRNRMWKLCGGDELTVGFLDYLLFYPFRDEDEPDLIVCSAEILHSFDDSGDKVRHRKTEVGPRLEHFANQLHPEVTWKVIPPDYERNKATRICPTFSPTVLKLKEMWRQAVRAKNPNLIGVVSGKATTRRDRIVFRKTYQAKGQAAIAEAEAQQHPMAAELAYLNRTSPNYFARLEKRLNVLEDRILKLNAEALGVNYRILEQLRISPQPLYKITSGSPRLYTIEGRLQLMSKGLRQELFSDCISYDLEAAQLAIIAAVWNIPSIQEKLTAGSAWAQVLGELHQHHPNLTKSQVKSILYPLIFGMPETNLHRRIKEKTGISGKRFFASSPTFQELLECRKQKKKQILEQEGITDAFGKWHVLERGKGISGARVRAGQRSLMAYEAQSYEAYFMRGLLRYIQEKDRYLKVNLLIHDGIYVQYTKEALNNPGLFERLEAGMQEVVNKAAIEVASNGIRVVTRLVRE